jgi:hypothetical protein
MRVLALLPTTGVLNRIQSIDARAELAASLVFEQSSNRQQDISRAYHDLTAKGGPLDRLGPPLTSGFYWMVLDCAVESGRSWELPALLAHLAVAHGHKLVKDPAHADIVAWATGAVAHNLDIVKQDYKLEAKAAYSRDDLQRAVAAGAKIVVMVPASEDDAPLRKLLADIGARDAVVEKVDSVTAARAILERALGLVTEADPPGFPWKTLIALAATVLAGFVTYTQIIRPNPAHTENVPVAEWLRASFTGFGTSATEAGVRTLAAVEKQPVPVKLKELRAENGGICFPVLYEGRTPRTIDVPLGGPDHFNDSTGRNLCGLEWSLNPEARGAQSIDIELPADFNARLNRIPGASGGWVKIRIDFMQEVRNVITYTVKTKFNDASVPLQQFTHTIR